MNLEAASRWVMPCREQDSLQRTLPWRTESRANRSLVAPPRRGSGDRAVNRGDGGNKKNSRSTPRTVPETCPSGSRQVRAFRLLLQRQVVRPRRGRFPVIESLPHWPGATGISNLRLLAGWISALEHRRFQGHKQKRKLKSVAPFARNRKFESISLQRTVRLSPAATFERRERRLSARVCEAGLGAG